ncbi:hypothetical protein AWB64_02517 [Caballeronia sordidicola]|uniref:DUF3592 domain-containing protein n=1 Tax=Caballeronia sordidicola TaxID=196367 RepID=A0A158GBM0_CABSO|nr:DUF3592 domain-containing protein [Caballeronia sordidicola]SAL29524.1 hypothetical protein AWB64_02517 [Caballeronia sordidicola]
MTNAPGQVSSIRKTTIVALLLGGGLFLLAIAMAVSSVISTRDMTAARGTVVRFGGGSQSLRSYTPVFAFTTAGGQRAETSGETSSTQPAYDIGQSVRIFYDAAHSARPVIVDEFMQRWFPAAVLAALGVAFLAIGAVLYRGDRPRISAAAPSNASYSQRKQQRNRQNLVISVLPVVIGAGFVLGAAATGFHAQHIRQNYSRAEGQVINVLENERPYQPHSRLYSAVIVFRTDTGKQISFAQGSSSSHNGLREGESVGVLYDAQTPERAMIDSFWEHWGLTAILLVIGIPFLAVGVFFLSTVSLGGQERKRVA